MTDSPQPRVLSFGTFEIDTHSGELRKAGKRVPLQDQPFRILVRLLQNPGELVTRDELRQELWPDDTFVDFEHGLNVAVKRLREALGDSADTPRFIETLPRRGYRFIAPVAIRGGAPASDTSAAAISPARVSRRMIVVGCLVALTVLLAAAYWRRPSPRPAVSGLSVAPLSRLTFAAGMQAEPTWSPDGRFIAYTSDQGGNFDIWVQHVADGRAVQVTTHPDNDWQPAFSPDGGTIAFRSERDGGGLFTIPVLGGRERRLASFGFHPQWSPDGARILFTVGSLLENVVFEVPHVYVTALDGSPPARILAGFLAGFQGVSSVTWHPDGKRISLMGSKPPLGHRLWTIPIAGGQAVVSEHVEKVGHPTGEAGLSPGPGRFRWAPSGDALYIEGAWKRLRNIWKVPIDPETLQPAGDPRRLTTTSVGRDSDVAVSSDGRIAYAMRVETTRVWAFPFDPVAGRTTGDGAPVTSADAISMDFDVSPDDRTLAYVAFRPGKEKYELWRKSLHGGDETLLGEADYYFGPRWSPDGTRLAYKRTQATPRRSWPAWLPSTGGEEHALPSGAMPNISDWSRDGGSLLVTCVTGDQRMSLCLLPLVARRWTEASTLVAGPAFHVWRGRWSPDYRWMCVQAQSLEDPGVSVLGISRGGGGTWTRLTGIPAWADKPQWAPDGKTIYFVGKDGGAFLNVWGLRFDPSKGTPLGEAFRVATFDSPRRMLVPDIGDMAMVVSATRLLVPIREVSASIWVQDVGN